MPRLGTLVKMISAGAAICIGGPALVVYVSPTEEELFKKYNPELQKRSLENRHQRQQDFDDYVTKLKEYSKSDKPIWEVQKQAEAKEREQSRVRILEDRQQLIDDAARRRQELLDSTKS